MEVRAEPEGYEVGFFKAGSVPGPLKFQRRERAPVWCLLSSTRREEDAKAEERVVGRLLQRYFQRGINAAPTKRLERRTIQLADREGVCRPAEGGKCGYRTLEPGHRPNMRQVASIIAHQKADHEPILDASLREVGPLFDSETERVFLGWAQSVLGPAVARFWPQFPMGAFTGDSNDKRRVDFLYEGRTAKRRIAVEIDGEEHRDWRTVDESRKDSMGRAGVKTIRIENHEVREGAGPNLAELAKLVGKDQKDEHVHDERSIGWATATKAADEGTAFQVLLSRMLEAGGFAGCDTVRAAVLHARPHGLEEAFNDWRELAEAFAEVHGMADKVGLPSKLRFVRPDEREHPAHMRIEGLCPWWHATDGGGHAHILRRVESNAEPRSRIDSSPQWRTLRGHVGEKTQRNALRTIVNDAFRIKSFREAQATAIGRCLGDKDTVVLLPTGAGKSLIYQMVGLLKPGPTVVVAPLVALIEDQIDALRSVGIDRVEGITSLDEESVRRDKMNRLVSGTTLIVVCAPERLMMPEFREQIGSLKATEGLAQIVIDEAHCVSEWGHDFRPAYLQLGRTVKERLGGPPVLALTGTASRAVYKDMIAHLEVDEQDPGAAIRPASHDRPEIKMELRYCTDRREAQDAAAGALGGLPDRFNERSQRFWRPKRGSDTKCGIVFMPTVAGRGNSVPDGKELARLCGARAIETYSSREERQRRRDAARNFKNNDASTMVCTKAYGMGVDKPNVRWVLHPHLTGTLESYYQEIGRAGRDRRDAIAIAIMREDDPARTNAILDQRKDWGEAKRIYEEARLSDDVGTSLFFHFRNFQGPQEESAAMMRTIDLLETSGSRGERNIPFPNDENDRTALERALGRLTRIAVVRDYEVDYGRGLSLPTSRRGTSSGESKDWWRTSLASTRRRAKRSSGRWRPNSRRAGEMPTSRSA